MKNTTDLFAYQKERELIKTEAKDIGQSGVAAARRLRRRVTPPPMLLGGVNRESDESVDGVLGVHWLNGTVPHGQIAEVTEYLMEMTGETPQENEFGRYRYDRSRYYLNTGIEVHYDSSSTRADSIHAGRALVSVPGSALDALDNEGLQTFIFHMVCKYSLMCTRIDICWDDCTRRITPHEVYEHAKKGNFKGYKVFRDQSERTNTIDGVVFKSDQVSFGVRGQNGSGKYLRIYDKYLESEGRINAIRWEVEYTKERARQVLFRLYKVTFTEEFPKLLAALVGGSIEFIDRESAADKTHAGRMTKLQFWIDIETLLGKAIVRLPQKKNKIENTVQWVEESVATSLACIAKAMEEEPIEFYDWLHEVISGGAARFTHRHKQMLREHYGAYGLTPEEINHMIHTPISGNEYL